MGFFAAGCSQLLSPNQVPEIATQKTLAVLAASASNSVSSPFHQPVKGTVVDDFRLPAHIGARGNRGLEYMTLPDAQVVAAAAGEVSFAGQVGGNLFVSILHPNGLKTSYGFLDSISVRKGQAVSQAEVVGRTSSSFHFSVRRNAEYLNPSQFLLSEGAAKPENPGSRLVSHNYAE